MLLVDVSATGQQFHLERIDDCAGDVVLDGEDARQVALELLRPEVVTVGCVHKLGSYANPISLLADAAFEYGSYVELRGDDGQLLVLSLEVERRGAG